MLHLLVIERERKGTFNVTPSIYGTFDLISSDPITGLGKYQDLDHLSFTFPTTSGNFVFDISSMNDNKFDIQTIQLDNDCSITLSFCVITPFNEIKGDQIELQFPKHYTIGHRGSGNNLVVNDFQENTLPSFFNAHKVGCDFVEFDIQLSKDHIPIIHHDFEITKKDKNPEIGQPVREEPQGEYHYAINQYTVDQFKKAKLDLQWHVENPTFSELLRELPMDLKFDIEIKYPFQNFNKHIPYSERNEFLDTILHEIAQEAGERQFFFSSFDINIIVMLILKQQRYPVYMLTTQEMYNEDTFEDFIRKTLGWAPLLKKIGVKGYVMNSLYMLKQPSLVQKLLDQGFTVSTYGKPNNEKEGIIEQLNLGVSGICTDLLGLANQVIREYDASK